MKLCIFVSIHQPAGIPSLKSITAFHGYSHLDFCWNKRIPGLDETKKFCSFPWHMKIESYCTYVQNIIDKTAAWNSKTPQGALSIISSLHQFTNKKQQETTSVKIRLISSDLSLAHHSSIAPSESATMPNSLRKFVTDARAVSCTNKNGSKRISGFHDETPSDGSFLWMIWASQHISVFKYRYKKYWDTLYIVPSLDLCIAIPLIYTANTTYIYVFIHVWIHWPDKTCACWVFALQTLSP